MKLVSIDDLKARMHAKIRLIGQLGPFMAGTFVRKANNGSVAYTVTSKVAGKTKSIYVPVDLADEVEQWTKEYKKMQKSVEGNQCDRGTDHQGVWGKKAGRKPKEQESGINNIGDLISVLLHYFPKFPDWLASIKDFRCQDKPRLS